MNIGIFKIGKPIYFKENEDDHASWSIEVINVIKILHERGHSITILSDTDYDGNEYIVTQAAFGLDRIYVWNGFTEDDKWARIFNMSADVRLILTDLALTPEHLDKFSHIYTQSKQMHTYGAIETSSLLHANLENITHEKSIEFYFGGTERGRTFDFLQYVYRPNQLWYGKSDSLGIRNYIPFHEHVELMKKTKYTIVIGDKTYNEHGFVTPRYYENLQYGVLPFVDNKYDSDGLVPVHPFLRVKNFIEMRQKITYLNEFPEEYVKIFQEAIAMIPQDMISGEFLYNQII